MSDVTEADLLKYITEVYAEAAQANEQDTWTAPRVRKALAERGLEVDDELWKSKWKAVASSNQSDAEEEQKQQKKTTSKRKGKDKYDRAAGKNLQVFLGAVAGDLLGGQEEDEGEEASEMDSDIGASEDGSAMDEEAATPSSDTVEEQPEPPKSKKSATSKGKGKRKAEEGDDEREEPPKPKRVPSKKRKKASPKNAKIKSAATISDSDEDASGTGSLGPASPSVGAGEEEGDEEAPVKKKAKKVSSSSKSEGEKKPRKKGSPKQLKEGEQSKGSDEEEVRVKKLKNLLSLAGTPRPFSKSTGAEKTMTISARLSHLEGLLNTLGLTCGSGVGTKMPSEAKAKELGEAKALEAEMKDITKGAVLTPGLRGGKKRAALPGQTRDDEDEEDDGPRKPFGAFLKAVQSSSDSD